MEKQIWQSLLDLKSWISNNPNPRENLFLMEQAGEWVWEAIAEPGHEPLLVVINDGNVSDAFPKSAKLKRKNAFAFEIIATGGFNRDSLQFYCEYLAYPLLGWEAIQKGRAITISHFAQSLDGRIATLSGDSKWIGSDANLIHAHRMRALCDGILIGSGTLKADKPALTVRHVEGQNPQRIVLGSSQNGDFESLKNSCSDVIWAIGKADNHEIDGVKCISLETAAEGNSNCEGLLQWLFQNGIHTVYIEGGAQTTSCFLAEGTIDILQLHISPQLFGSGLSGIQLAEIEEVKEAVQFSDFEFQRKGESVMFVGEPQKPASK